MTITTKEMVTAGLGGFGTAMSAASSFGAANSYIDIAEYNIALLDKQLEQQLADLRKLSIQTTSTQKAAASASGLGMGSRSSLAVIDDTLTQFESAALTAQENNEYKKRSILFQAEAQADAARGKGVGSLIRGIGTIAGALLL